MAKKDLPDIETLRQLFRYDVETGKLYWLERNPSMFKDGFYSAKQTCARWNSINANNECGCINKNDYVAIRINRKKYYAHRIIWALFNNEKEEVEIDHINGNKQDNRIVNLRKVTRTQNNWNARARKDSSTNVRGVYPYKNKWRASITVNEQRIYLGDFFEFEKAVAARKDAELKYYGEYARAS